MSVSFATDNANINVTDAKHVLHAKKLAFVRAITGHVGAVNGVAYSKDGLSLFSGGADKTVRLWTAADGKAVRMFTGPTAEVTCLSLSIDGTKLVAGSTDKSVYSWTIPAAAATPVVAELTLLHSAAVTSVDAGTNGSRIATSIGTAEALVWDTATATVVEKVAGHTLPVLQVLLGADNKMIVTTSADMTARVGSLSYLRSVKAAAGKVVDLSASADATLLVSVGEDKKVKIWNFADGKLVHEVSTGAVGVTSADIRADKLQLAATTADMKLNVWPIAAAGPGAVSPTTLTAAGSRVRYSIDGSKLAVSCADNKVQVFDSTSMLRLEEVALPSPSPDVAWSADGSVFAAVVNSVQLHSLALDKVLTGHEGAVTASKFSLDGLRLYSGGADKTVRQWTIADGKQVGTFSGPATALTDISVSGDGKVLAGSSLGKNVFVWPLAAPTPAPAPAPVAPTATLVQTDVANTVRLNADGTRAVVACGDGVVRVWDVAATAELERFEGHEGIVHGAVFNTDGSVVVSAGADKSTRVWHVSATKVIVADPTSVAGMAYFADGSQLLTAGMDGKAKLWNADGTLAKEFAGATAPLTQVAARPDKLQVAAVDYAGKVYLWKVVDGALEQTIDAAAIVHGLSYDPSGTRIAASTADNLLRVWDTTDAQLLQQQTAAAALTAVRFTSDGRDLLAGGTDKTITTWAHASPTSVREFLHPGVVYSVACSSDGKMIATSGADQTIRLWDLATGAAIKPLAGHVGSVYSIRFNADSKQVVSAGADGTVRIWDVAAGTVVKTFVPEVVENVTAKPAFDASPNAAGQVVASGYSDGSIRLWNATTGAATKILSEHTTAVYRVEFSADGTKLLTTDQTGKLVVRNPATGVATTTASIPGVAYSASFSPDAKTVIVTSADQKAYLVTVP